MIYKQIGDNATFLLMILQFRRYFLVSDYVKSKKKGIYIRKRAKNVASIG